MESEQGIEALVAQMVSENMAVLWTIVAAALVLFMQAGFCMLEAGSVRTKNNINVAVKNIIDLCATIAIYFVVGYALMFGVSKSGFVGEPTLFLDGVEKSKMVHFLFQATFCATAATIVSGGIAERSRFLPYVVVSVLIGAIIYPVFGHWVWADGGWLSGMGFTDFAGSAVVHMVGGAVALAGIQVLGARTGRFSEDGQAQEVPASSMPQVAVGACILLFGWIGFNGGSADFGDNTATIIVNTLIAAAFGGVMALLSTWAYGGLAAVSVIINGLLGGLVAITACAHIVEPVSAMIIGLAGGLTVVLGTVLLEKLKLDDAVGAVPVHLMAGVTGIILTAVFCLPEAVPAEKSRLEFVGIQALGAAVCFAWAYGLGYLVWRIIGVVMPLRVGPLEEKVGLNYSEHRVPDPMSGLTAMVASASRGEPLSPDHVAQVDESEFAVLGRSLAEILQRGGSGGDTRAWVQELDTARLELEARLQQQESRSRKAAEGTDAIAGLIGRLQAYLQDHREESTVVPLLIDLLQQVHGHTSHVSQELQGNLGKDLVVASALNTLARRMEGTP